jgi:hypothetical protein
MDEQQPGYETILSQLLTAVAGRGLFYYIASAGIFFVLTYSAQTSFTGFPRVCRFLAEDDFLPHAFANRGRRLVFSHGVIVLAILSGVLLTAFGGVTHRLTRATPGALAPTVLPLPPFGFSCWAWAYCSRSCWVDQDITSTLPVGILNQPGNFPVSIRLLVEE